MSIDTEALKASTDLVSVISAFVALKKRGSEYVGLCPFHADKTPSFYAVPSKGFCTCFGCGFSGDVIGFIQEAEGLDFKAACERLGAKPKWEPKSYIAPPDAPRPDRITSKPPADAGRPNMEIRGLGQPSKIWPYRDTDGGILGYVTRYETEKGKEIRCWTWGARGSGNPGWGCGHWSAPRPLFGLDRLAAAPGTAVLIVEGEKACDAAGRLLAQYYVPVTWPAGANAWHKSDWRPLRGRTVLIWPDADHPGWAVGDKLAALLADPKGLACKVRVVDTSRMPEGWDIADAEADGWDTARLIEWAKPRARDYEQPSTAPQGGAGAEPSPMVSAPPAGAVPDEPPPPEFPPDASPIKPVKRKPRLAVVGNTALALDPDTEPLPQSMSEDALADAFADKYGVNWRYVRRWGAWYEWDGEGWRHEETGKIDSLAVQVTREALYWPEAGTLTPRERRQVNKRSTAGAVRDLAGADRRIAATVDQWDADPWQLGVPGGVYDLKAAKLIEAEQGQYITKRAAVAPAPGTPARWLEYLDRCHMGNAEVIAYLRRFAGYSCTGEIGEHALAFLYGTGRNGKGVFLETISRILGDYAKTASIQTFLEQKNPAHSTELARLHKARLVITEEAAAGGRWNESRIKHMTGGGKITARFMRMDDFEFTPNFKLMVAANHKPSLRSVDEAIKARIHLVPFTVTIPPEERDPYLVDKLREEWPQILGWMLEGCMEWQERGLTPPQRILDATQEYMQSEDVLGDWIAECCDNEGELDGATGYQNYKKWCEAQGHTAWSRMGWSKAVSERDTIDSRRSNGRTIYLGLSLRLGAGSPG